VGPGAAARIEALRQAGLLRPRRERFGEPEDLERFQRVLDEWLPGFELASVNAGEEGLVLHERLRGRGRVLQTHPFSRDVPCWFEGFVDVPSQMPRLRLAVGHHQQGDWRLEVRVDEKSVLDTPVGEATCKDGWREISVDLTQFAGRRVLLQLFNHASGWAWEFGYWDRVEIVGG
jgi:hypothetical protein